MIEKARASSHLGRYNESDETIDLKLKRALFCISTITNEGELDFLRQTELIIQ